MQYLCAVEAFKYLAFFPVIAFEVLVAVAIVERTSSLVSANVSVINALHRFSTLLCPLFRDVASSQQRSGANF